MSSRMKDGRSIYTFKGLQVDQVGFNACFPKSPEERENACKGANAPFDPLNPLLRDDRRKEEESIEQPIEAEQYELNWEDL